jgi:hypothetical protein
MKKKYSLKYIKTKECENLIFGDDFDHFSRWNIESMKSLHTFKNSYLFNNELKKKWCIG